MKVTIENQITAHNLLWVRDLNNLIEVAKKAANLPDLCARLNGRKYQTLTYGFGTNHCWVKQMDMTCKLNDERTLFITEN